MHFLYQPSITGRIGLLKNNNNNIKMVSFLDLKAINHFFSNSGGGDHQQQTPYQDLHTFSFSAPCPPLNLVSYPTLLIHTTRAWVVALVTHLCPTLRDLMHYSPLGDSVHGILQARILKWVAIPFSRRSSQPRDQTQFSWISGRFFID